MSKIYTTSSFVDFCRSVFGGYHLTNASENINVVCPICRKNKDGVYTKRKLVVHSKQHYLHCWVCSYKSKNLLHLLKAFYPHKVPEYVSTFLKSENISLEQQKIKTILKLPEEFKLLSLMDTEDEIASSALSYLAGRGIQSKSDLWYWRFGIVKSLTRLSGRIIMPSYDSYGRLNYYTARSFIDNRDSRRKRYENPDVSREDIIFNELNLDWSKELTIVEGPFDLLKCNDNATAILGSTFDTNYKLFEKIVINKTPVLLALDNDNTGIYKSKQYAKLLNEYDIDVRILSYEDNKHEDVGSMSKSEFSKLRENAILYDRDNALLERIQNIL